MKKKFAVIGLLATVLTVLVLFCGCACEVEPTAMSMADSGYTMKDLDVTIDASAGDRSMRITETYTFTFHTASQGFYRDIPVNSGEKVRDIRLSDARDFSNTCKVSYESQVVRVRVGKEGSYRTGTGRATLSYTLYTPTHAVYPDAIVVNAIGHGWSCEIAHATVHVLLPAETNEVPQYYYGALGTSNDACSDFNPWDAPLVSQVPEAGAKEYTFEVTRPLSAYTGLTLYYFLPKGVLATRTDLSALWIILSGVGLIGILVVLKLLLGRSPALTPIVNFYPPKHVGDEKETLPMDPVDMGYLIDGASQGSDVTSLIFYFAAQGYLEISEEDEKKKGGNFTLHKTCNLPKGLPKYQYTLFNKLFDSGDTVTVSDLTNRTYTAVQSVQRQIASKYRRSLYDNKAVVASWSALLFTVLFSVIAVLVAGMSIYRRYFYLFGLVALLPACLSMFLVSFALNQKHKLRPALWYLLAVAAVLVAVAASLLLLLAVPECMLGLPARLCLVAIVAMGSLLAPTVRRRTRSYTEELNNILGFKDFLETAEKDKLEMLLEENPQYYYDILPYANVLGVSDKWQNKFAGLTLEPPRYYRSSTLFNLMLFNTMYRNSYRAYSAATISRPSSSSSSGGRHGGFGGGGGFSGGGFGGGGGGRW